MSEVNQPASMHLYAGLFAPIQSTFTVPGAGSFQIVTPNPKRFFLMVASDSLNAGRLTLTQQDGTFFGLLLDDNNPFQLKWKDAPGLVTGSWWFTTGIAGQVLTIYQDVYTRG